MMFSRSALSVLLPFSMCAAAVEVRADTAWSVVDGRSVISLNEETLRENGVRIESVDSRHDTNGEALQDTVELKLAQSGSLTTSRVGSTPAWPTGGLLAHEGGLVVITGGRTILLAGLELAATGNDLSFFTLGPEGSNIEMPGMRVSWDMAAQTFRLRAPDLLLSKGLARKLGIPKLAGLSIGSLELSATMAIAGGEALLPEQTEPVDVVYDLGADPRGGPTWTCGGAPGPDVIVGDLVGFSGNSLYQVTAIDTGGGAFVDAFSAGTTSCNVGTQPLSWVDEGGSNAHPVIGQNFFRLQNGRYEQIGQSWLKHGFFALQGTVCCASCSPQPGDLALGVGCSDPYSADRNAGQAGAGPKYQVNPTTGVHIHPVASPGYSGTIARRLQVLVSDCPLSGALYFVEGQYVTADDAANGNQNNNASYRQVLVTGTTIDRTFTLTGTTQRAQCGIRAWKDQDPTVVQTDVQVSGDGLYIVGVKTTDLGDGYYHYEYAIQNLNSNRAARQFSVPIISGATVRNIGFHDVPYHSGDGEGNVNRDGTDWPGVYSGGSVTWTMVDVGSNSNALRWGTLYNFRFDANVQPAAVDSTLTLFASGSPASVTAATQGPAGSLIVLDCNGNGIDDLADINALRSSDCNGDFIPDECETPCDLKTVRVAVADQPSFVTAPPGDTTRLFITELPGRIRILDLTTGNLLPTLFIDLTSLVASGGEDGLFSMAFHPNYATNGKFYVNYTTLASPRRTRIVEYTVSGNPNVANAGSAVILKEIAQPFSNHNGGQLQFGRDGMLYCGMGDGGSQGDPNNQSQTDSSLLGKMLRLNVDNPPTYVPVDNPGGSWLPEVWAKGFRNPWRFSFDRLNGDLYVGDVGQSVWEEIDYHAFASPGGENYGWRCYEGNAAYNGTGCGPIGDYKFPIAVVNHNDAGTASITGGYVYRGCEIPGLAGTYFYADYAGNWVRSFRYDGTTVTDQRNHTAAFQPDAGSLTAMVSFGEDASGELYICCLTGGVYKIVCDIVAPSTCGNDILEPGEECETPDGVNCDCNCQIVDDCTPSFSDNFETDQLWTVSGNAADGQWSRGVPVNCSSRGAPATAYGGSGQCYVTDNSTTGPSGQNCDSDVDGTTTTTGTTILTSPSFNLASGGQIRYAYWLMDTPSGELGPGDGLTVEVSTNGGTNWNLLRSYNAAQAVWRTDVILVGGASGEIAGSSNMRIRFSASDAPPGDVVECGVDEFIACSVVNVADCNINCVPDATDIADFTSFDCNNNGVPDECEQGVAPCDCNHNSVNDAIDIAMHTSADCNENDVPDECDIMFNPSLDCDGGPVGVASGGAAIFMNTCMFCHNVNGNSGNGNPFPCGGPCPGPNIRNHSRVQIWTMLLPPTIHPGGAHPEFSQQDFADLEAYLADGGSRGRPDGIPDSCELLTDCDNDQINDGCELEAGSQHDVDYDGLPDECEGPCGVPDGDFDGDTDVDGIDLDTFVNALLGTPTAAEICHGDFSSNSLLDTADINGMVDKLIHIP